MVVEDIVVENTVVFVVVDGVGDGVGGGSGDGSDRVWNCCRGGR